MTCILLFCFTSFHVGNSLTNDSVFELSPDGVNIGFHIDSGQPLNTIRSDPNGVDFFTPSRWPDALLQPWNVVTLQPHQKVNVSFLSTDIDSIANFVAYSNADEFYVLETWPRTESWEPLGSYAAYWEAGSPPILTTPTIKQRAYFDGLMENVDMWMVPTGEVLFALEQKGEDLSAYYRNPAHLSNELGRYVASTTLLTTIRRQHPRENIPGPLVDPNKVQIIQDTVWEVVTSHQWSGYSDFNQDGTIDGADLTEWGTSGRPGEDFLAWQRQMRFSSPIQPSDFDGNGEVNGFDFLLWQRDPSVGSLADWKANYGMVAALSASSAAVPEPTTCTLALAALCLAMGRRRAF